ncbi:MAG: FAD-dependent oxidoreductase [Candidatus Binataceae bacterium]
MTDQPSSATASRQRPVYTARIERIFDHAADTRSLFLHIVEGGSLRFVPGQFISISIPLSGETRIRPYSLASSPEDGEPLEICFNQVPGGEGVRWLFGRIVGDTLSFTGPFGTFTMEHRPTVETVFVAEGTSIAPIRPMLRRALADSAHPALSLLYAADAPEHLLYRDEIEQWARRDSHFSFDPIVVAPADLHARMLEEVERRWVKADANRRREFYVCGIGKGVIAIRDLLRGSGYERRAVHYEQW